ncbi:MAG TPA: hypothetical protein VFE75_05515 [Rhodanobacter sp.]|jgi:hypothetical protein|nr:hypothetical protein [Rhodanobacter sp.]
MSPVERIARILADVGHAPADVAHYIERLQQSFALRTLPRLLGHKLSDRERHLAYQHLREGHTVEEILAKLQQG